MPARSPRVEKPSHSPHRGAVLCLVAAVACAPGCADMLGFGEIEFGEVSADASAGGSGGDSGGLGGAAGALPDGAASDSLVADAQSEPPPDCADGTCGAGESCANCPVDCGQCPPPPGCPDGTCDIDESCWTCPLDCGECSPSCPNGVCDAQEDCWSCYEDCGECPSNCNDGVCDAQEDCWICPEDCGDCVPGCPSGVCDDQEDCTSCPEDCGDCGPVCPDGACTDGEMCSSCPEDCGACPPTVNDDPSRLLVYTINYENLMTPTSAGDPAECQGDWTELIDQIAGTVVAPDIVLIQQMSGKAGYGSSPVETVESALSQRFPGQSWNTIVAESQPASWAGANCPAKALQTNGIMYRIGRLDYVDSTKKTLMARINDNGSCPEGQLSRNLAVFAKFGDRANGLNSNGGYLKEVALGSVHWPVEDGCGVTNANLTDGVLMTYTGAQMYIWGGDINLPDRDTGGWMFWYSRANGDLGGGTLGYRDPVFQACGGQAACLDANATLKVKRYDFIFAKYRPTYNSGLPMTDGQWTVPWDPDNDGLKYSMHKAVKSYVHW